MCYKQIIFDQPTWHWINYLLPLSKMSKTPQSFDILPVLIFTLIKITPSSIRVQVSLNHLYFNSSFQMSKTAPELVTFIESQSAEDPLIKGVPEDKNPFKEKGGCVIT